MSKQFPNLITAIVATIVSTKNIYFKRYLQLSPVTLSTAGQLYLRATFLEPENSQELMNEFNKIITDLINLFPYYLESRTTPEKITELLEETVPPVHYSKLKIYEDFLITFIYQLRALELIKQ